MTTSRESSLTGPIGRESDKFMLRLPDGMRDLIKSSADKHSRSMNAEIVAVLRDHYVPMDRLAYDVEQMVRMLAMLEANGHLLKYPDGEERLTVRDFLSYYLGAVIEDVKEAVAEKP